MRNLVCRLAALLVLFSLTAPLFADGPACTLRGTVVAHLDAVESRDLETLIATITTGEKLTLIFPDGEKLDTRQQFVELHEGWFADESWRMEMELVDLIETAELGHALVRYRYSTETEGEAPPSRERWLALTFAREEDCWRLVFDQNTAID